MLITACASLLSTAAVFSEPPSHVRGANTEVVEVFAICKDPRNGPWWRPDGSRFSTSPYRQTEGLRNDIGPTVQLNQWTIIVGFRAKTMPSIDFLSRPKSSGDCLFSTGLSAAASSVVQGSGLTTWWSQARYAQKAPGAGLTCTVCTASEPWKTIGSVKLQGRAIIPLSGKILWGLSDRSAYISGSNSEPASTYVTVKIPDAYKGFATRVVAQDRQRNSPLPGTIVSRRPGDPPTEYQFMVKQSELGSLLLEARPWHEQKLLNLPLKPLD